MKEEEVNRCQIQEWYPIFKKHSIRTEIHELPESFIQYLLDDSDMFLLPVSISNKDALPNRIHKPEEEEDYTISEEQSDNESEQNSQPPPSFPELESQINKSIETLGGAIFPKLNWSSPKDAAWISPHASLKCTSFSEIVLLLKASDSLLHDLCHAYDSCSDCTSRRPTRFFLALRTWYTIHPEREFRVFIRDYNLVGISQREVTVFFPLLVIHKKKIEELIEKFYRDRVIEVFDSERYTLDVYVTKEWQVKLVDFNPWCESTLPLLFTWDELESEKLTGELEFRIVESRLGVRPGLKTAVPYDYMDTSEGSGWDQFLRNADVELRKQMNSDVGSSTKKLIPNIKESKPLFGILAHNAAILKAYKITVLQLGNSGNFILEFVKPLN